MLRRILQVVFTVLGLVRASNATLSFNAPSSFLNDPATISVDQCGTTHNIKPVSVSSTEGQAPIFSISDSTGVNAIFEVANNENLRCVDKSALEAAGKTTYNLTIGVSSATEPEVSFTFELTITGLATNPSTPTFTPTSHSLTISAHKFDEEGEFTLAETFDVTDSDSGAAGTVTYSLKNSPPEFGFSSSSGTVSIQVKASTLALDSPYELVVIATDGGSPPKTGSATMAITLNHRPTFTDPTEGGTITVCEKEAAQTVIKQMTASDQNSDVLTFEISANDVLEVDGTDLKLKQEVDYETAPALSIPVTLTVRDATLSSEISVTIELEDHNDNAPVFEGDYEVSILDTTPGTTTVLTAIATDGDRSAPNNQIVFSLSGQDNAHFAINASTGVITVADPSQLNYGTKSSYTLTITATDRGDSPDTKSSTQEATITLKTAPVFSKPTASNDIPSVTDGTAVGVDVYTLEATDADGQPGPLNYSIVSQTPNGVFAISGDKLQVAEEIDREAYDSVTLKFRVTDGENNVESVEVTVTINDKNDISPVFSNTPSTASISENAQAGTEVLRASATDGDATHPNNRVVFSLSGDGNADFDINATTGILTVGNPSALDYTTKSTYTLTITATDGGAEPDTLSTEHETVISIETTPVFAKPIETDKTAAVDEGVPVGTSVYTLTATDEDGSVPLTFSIKSQTPGGLFRINGAIVETAALIDAEAHETAAVVFSVTDGQYSSDSVSLAINITDVNDNTPIFSTTYAKTINEDLPLGSSIIQVSAQDGDRSSPFNTVTYSITGGNTESVFQIGAITGWITLEKIPLDLSFTLTVTAADGGNPPETADVSVSISINGDAVNECANTPCLNGATCRSHVNYYKCFCAPGWQGVNCSSNIDDCTPNPCQNNGRCIDAVQNYTCDCSEGYHGYNCTEVCSGHTYGRNCAQNCACPNTARLAEGVENTQMCDTKTGDCLCVSNWTGPKCAEDVNECSPTNAALNTCDAAAHKICNNTVGGFKCDCMAGFTVANETVCVAVSAAQQADNSALILGMGLGLGIPLILIVTAAILAWICCCKTTDIGKKHRKNDKYKRSVSSRPSRKLPADHAIQYHNAVFTDKPYPVDIRYW